MHFSRLRLLGFKSFVEPTDLLIPPGLTGVVGPNGCGKSNLVEALRWVMGENSAKRMRGTEMDDVIFAGTTARPARNFAEVSLQLENPERDAAPEWNDSESMEVVRRIEREKGSDYRVNGKPVRQRDVQTLFADMATGAHATSMVSQGRIGALIQAKPQDRRAVLEEAAGLSGLHARRHEAELKLRAAEQNLTRVEDVIGQMDQQLRTLKQQARQAARYRSLSERIRKAEAAQFHLKWQQGEEQQRQAETAMQAAESAVAARTLTVAEEENARLTAHAAVSPARDAAAAAGAALQRVILDRENLEAEERRLAEETASLERRRTEAEADREREQTLLTDAVAALAEIETRLAALSQQAADCAEALPQAESELAQRAAVVASAESAQDDAARAVTVTEESLRSLDRRAEAARLRTARLQERQSELTQQSESLRAEIAARADLSLAATLVSACETEVLRKQQTARDAEDARHAAGLATSAARATRDAAARAQANLRAERMALQALLEADEPIADPAVDAIVVPSGLEAALAAAMGDALSAGLRDGAPRYWLALEPMGDAPSLPPGATPLSTIVVAPPALARALSAIGLVDDAIDLRGLAPLLKPGQALVNRNGMAIRWDGYTVSAGAPDATATRLKHRNRLQALMTEQPAVDDAASASEEALQQAQAHETQTIEADRAARDGMAAAFAALQDAQQALAQQREETAAATTQLQTAEELARAIAADLVASASESQNAESERAALPDLAQLIAAADSHRETVQAVRGQYREQQATVEGLRRESAMLKERAGSLRQEQEGWNKRQGSAESRIRELTLRQEQLVAALQAIADKPAEIAERRDALLTRMQEAEGARAAAADALAAAEQGLAERERALKIAEAALAEARESRVRAEGERQAAEAMLSSLQERIAEKLAVTPDALPAIAEITPEDSPTLEKCEADLSRLYRERDTMGAVNLRAEEEAQTLGAELDRLTGERDDLTNAIGKLRQGIATLNREARDRLVAAYEQVDKHFQELFVRLFGGGRAHLQLTEAEDPLECGLEIYASPPGKKMQVLSLLSGGEQALTAVALLFAIFLTNPSPICVLDEVDAPLDEANVGRFCDMVAEIAGAGRTRFLIITHNRLTMARMDRLYGVTMVEKGVSQLVSVDLRTAEQIAEKASASEARAAERAEEALSEIVAAEGAPEEASEETEDGLKEIAAA